MAKKPITMKEINAIHEDRDVEVLHNVDPKEMSKDEAINYIEFLRGEYNKALSQMQLLDGNCQQAYETLRMTQQSLMNHKTQTAKTERFILQAVKTMHDSLLLAMSYKEEPTNGN